jgi:hypothetical protein
VHFSLISGRLGGDKGFKSDIVSSSKREILCAMS